MSFRREIFGLDISDFSIEVMLLRRRFGRVSVKAYGREKLDAGIVANGKILKPKELAKKIRSALKHAKPSAIKSLECVVSLPESQVFTHTFTLPANLKRKQIQNTLPFEAEKVIPITSNEVNFDFKILHKDKDGQEVFYLSTPSKIVESYTEVLSQAGVEAVAVDLESNSLARVLIKNPNRATMVVDIGARTTNVSVYDRFGVRFSSVIRLGGNDLTDAIAKQLKVSPEEAESLKRKNGFTRKEQGKVFMIIQNHWAKVIHELKDIIEFYQASHGRDINQVILAGGTSMLPNISQYFKDNLGVDSLLGDPFQKIKSSDVELNGSAVLYANVIGLAWRGIMRRPEKQGINLLSLQAHRFKVLPQKAEKVAWRRIYNGSVALLIFVIALVGLIWARRELSFLQPVKPNYEQVIVPENDFDVDALDELRQEETNTLTDLATGTATTTKTPEPIAEVAPNEQEVEQNYVVVDENSVGFLNVRSGPSTSNSILTKLDIGDELQYLERQPGWVSVVLDDGTVGWVSDQYVSFK
ncbi:MAG: hypothetical protein COT81_05650 [Candidatus Buchananbacteria bacterium CG10_big_fil_rev_8_21_14_0_10_42_9]|uniref:SH3b domain-containing protein n=1 Tax=Candidatus Buchananbacteria bacterium CG10_big_fil_rev_8_21_14_0_10_42_9 TaxID=1974526 RepID=A0A2H0W1U7_9BACT|nr:MAG: hypothetical protein COT81_05650 [Candidatus Buchananbacteria bacterium CG10_big_fil_rev_8_21_14_0_10_42_9]